MMTDCYDWIDPYAEIQAARWDGHRDGYERGRRQMIDALRFATAEVTRDIIAKELIPVVKNELRAGFSMNGHRFAEQVLSQSELSIDWRPRLGASMTETMSMRVVLAKPFQYAYDIAVMP